MLELPGCQELQRASMIYLALAWAAFMVQAVIKLLLLCIKTFPPRQNGRHFADNIFRSIFMNEKFWILIKISLKFVSQGPIENNPASVDIMTWRLIGNKPLLIFGAIGFQSDMEYVTELKPWWILAQGSINVSQTLQCTITSLPQNLKDVSSIRSIPCMQLQLFYLI